MVTETGKSGEQAPELQETRMRFKPRIAAAVALALMLVPDVAVADERNCSGPEASQHDDCKEKREKPRFQTKFFSE